MAFIYNNANSQDKNKYLNVTFNSNGGSNVENITSNENSPISQPNSPTKIGYSFDGWFQNQELSNKWIFKSHYSNQEYQELSNPTYISQIPNGQQKLDKDGVKLITLPFQVKLHNQIFPPGHQIAVSDNAFVNFNAGNVINNSNNPFSSTNTIWILSGDFCFRNNGSLAAQIIGSQPNRILVFQWKNLSPNNDSYKDYFANLQLKLFENGNIQIHFGNSNMKTQNNNAATAIIGNNTNSFINVEPTSPINFHYNNNNTLFVNNNNIGNIFRNNININLNFGPPNIITQNTTLFAKWIQNFSVRFNLNNADYGNTPQTLSANLNQYITLPNQLDINKNGFNFAGWNTKQDGSGTNYPQNYSLKVIQNITLYAKWISIPGSGTQNDPYKIRSKQDLDILSQRVNSNQNQFNNPNVHYQMQNDVDMKNEPFIPIGTSINGGWETTSGIPFRGKFDGNGYNISNLYIHNTSTYATGLFGFILEAEVKNVNVISGDIRGFHVGAVVSFVGANSTVINCSNGATVTHIHSAAHTYLGGVIARIANTSIVSYCYNYGTVSVPVLSHGHIGGVVGSNDGRLFDCYNKGSVIVEQNNSNGYYGGVLGVNYGYMERCYDIGIVNGGVIHGYYKYVRAVCGVHTGNTISGQYYLNTLPNNFIATGGYGATDQYNIQTAMTSVNMQSANFINTLNAGRSPAVWAIDTNNININYPVLAWQNIIRDPETPPEPIPTPKYTLTYDKNGADVTGTAPAATKDIEEYDSVNLANIGNLAKTGYSFAGWNTQADGKGTNYNIGDKFIMTENSTLYARWIISHYIISFNLNGGYGKTPEEITKVTQATIILPTSNGFNKNNSHFIGWSTSPNDSTKIYPEGSDYAIQENVIFYAQWWWNGYGTSDDPLRIRTREQIDVIAQQVNSGDVIYNNTTVYFRLECDIDMEGFNSDGSINNPFNTPIGVKENPFRGVFDGNGYKFNNLFLDNTTNTTSKATGVFGYTAVEAQILNFSIAGDGVIKGNGLTGGIVGNNKGLIENCFSAATVNGSLREVGGIAGENEGIIYNSYNSGKVIGEVGGVGGIAGSNFNVIEKCYNLGDVTGELDDIGGIAGYNAGDLIKVYNKGNIFGNGYCGGIVGYNNANVNFAYNNGNSRGLASYVGGVVGYNNSLIVSAYSTGNVNAMDNVAAFVGWNANEIKNSMFLSSIIQTRAGVNQTPTACGGKFQMAFVKTDITGKDTAGLQSASATDLLNIKKDSDFNNPFYTVTDSFPMLVWQESTISFDINGGTGTKPADVKAKVGSGIMLPDTTGFSKDGYHFGGWNTTIDGFGVNYQAGGDMLKNNYQAQGNATLYAQWYKFGGLGTKDTPFQIKNRADMDKFSAEIRIGNKLYNKSFFALANNIDMNNTHYIPIGDKSNSFKGTFDGSGYAINNLLIDDLATALDMVGLFGTVAAEAIVRNLGISSGSQIKGNDYVAGIVGNNFGLIENCYNMATITSSGYYVAGIAGSNSGTLLNCHNNGLINGTNPVGGIVGINKISGKVFNVYNTGSLNGEAELGGIAGTNNGKIENAHWLISAAQSVNNIPLANASKLGVGSGSGNNSDIHSQTELTMQSAKFVSTLINRQSPKPWSANLSNNGYPVLSINGGREVFYVQFDNNGGDGEIFDAIWAAKGENVTIPSTAGLTRKGHSALLWNTLPTSNGSDVQPNSQYTVSWSIILYAKWTTAQYTVTFNGNTNTGGNNTQQIMFYDTPTPLNANAFTKTGYAFVGWMKNANISITSPITPIKPDYADRFAYSIGEGNVNLYALWKPNFYVISYNANGGTFTGNTTKQVTFDAKYETLVTPNRVGFNFTSWNTMQNGSGDAINEDKIVKIPNNHSLYAQWKEKTYIVTFDANGATSGSMANQGLKYQTPAPLIPNAFAKTGHSFAGWATSQNGNVAFTERQEYSITANDVVLYAKWTPNTYNITFNANSGTGVMNNQGVIFQVPTNIIANSFTKTGHSFAGWALTNNGTIAYNNNATYKSNDANITLYAIWNANNYILTFNGNSADSGSTNNPANTQTFAYGIAQALAANNFSKIGYAFAGWWTVPTAFNSPNEVVYSDKANYSIAAGNATIFAKWVAKSFTVKFNSTGGSVVADKNVTFDSTYGTLTASTRSGFVFSGWFTAENGTGTLVNEATKVNISAQQTLYAKWTVADFVVTFNANGGTGTMANQSFSYNEKLNANKALNFNAFAKVGNKFLGWSNTANGNVIYLNAADYTINAGAVTLFAIWQPDVFLINYVLNNGILPANAPTSYSFGSTVTLPNNSTRVGYDFAGWFNNSALTGSPIAAILATDSGNKNFYAKWNLKFFDTNGNHDVENVAYYTVTYHPNGGTGTTPANQIAVQNSKITLPLPALNKAGVAFRCWALDQAGNIRYSAGTSYSVGNNVTLYAQYGANFTAEGAGTDANPFRIRTRADLDLLSSYINNATNNTIYNNTNIHYRMENDVDMGGSAKGSFTPIGMGHYNTAGNSFTAKFDGNGYEVRNLYIHLSDLSGVGFFGCTVNSEIKNLGIGLESNIYGGSWCGGIVGFAKSSTMINCYNKASISSSGVGGYGSFTGGIVGGNSYSTVKGCYNAGTIANGGGVVGDDPGEQYSTIIDCYNIGRVNGGGIYINNDNPSSKVTNCYNIGTVTVGGPISGPANPSGVVYSSYYLNTSGTGGYGTSYTQPQMCNNQSFINTLNAGRSPAIWKLDSQNKNNGYPILVGVTYGEQIPIYTASFNINGGVGSVASQTVREGSSITLPTSSGINRNNYVFAGWNTQANGRGSNYAGGSGYTVTNNITLYAKWWWLGNGTAADPYLIRIKEDMVQLSTRINNNTLPYSAANTYYRMENDIDMKDVSWSPIGNAAGTTFKGHFNGNGYTLNNLTINLQSNNNVGLFGYTAANATISNLTVGKGSTIKANKNTGSLVGNNQGLVKNCANLGNVDVHNGTAGGIVGYNEGKIEDCYNSGIINGTNASTAGYIGGLIGENQTGGTLLDSYNLGQVKGAFSLGGLIGSNVTGAAIPENSYYLKTLTGNAIGGGTTNAVFEALSKKDAAAMKSAKFTKDLNRNDEIWGADISPASNNGYPIFINFGGRAIHELKYNGNTYTDGTLPANVIGGSGTRFIVGDSDNFSKRGGSFIKWNTRADGNGTSYNPGEEIILNFSTTLYAQWDVKRSTIYYNGNNATAGSMANDYFYYGAGQALSRNNYVKTGYSFSNWNTQSDNLGTAYTNQESFTIGENDVTLYAIWSANNYTVSFNNNSGSGTIAVQTFTYDIAKNLTSNSFTKPGHSFMGWSLSADNSNVVYANQSSYQTSASNVTLYAVWQRNNYSITYDINTGDTGEMLSQSFSYNTSGSLIANTYNKIGYHFINWNTQANGSGTNYLDKCTYTIGASNVTLYAQWAKNSYVIIFDGNGNTGGTTTSQTLIYNNATVLNANGYNRTGYEFVGWSNTANGAVEYIDRAGYVIGASNAKLYAKWTPKVYQLSFDGNGSDGGVMAKQAFTFGLGANLSSNNYSKTGYTFIGWARSAAGEVSWNNIANYTFTVAENATVYAKWQANVYNITFNSNSGTGAMANQGFTYDSPAKLDGNTFTKEGHSFIGWSETANGDASWLDRGIYNTVAAHTTLYAKWASNKYAVIFDGNAADNGEMLNQEFTYKISNNLSANLYSKIGHVFLGWVLDKSNTTLRDYGNQGSFTIGSADVTLYALWKPMQYDIKYNMNGGGPTGTPIVYDFGIGCEIGQEGYVRNAKEEFGGFYDNATFTGERIYGFSDKDHGNKELWAKWTGTVSFDSNFGFGVAPEPMITAIGTNIYLPSENGLQKEGYIFAGWNTKPDGSGSNYVIGEQFTVNHHVTLYAKWWNFSGFGHAAEPYRISDRYGLDILSNLISNGIEPYCSDEVYYQLDNDIDMGGTVFTPIGNSMYQFKGKFNGNGFAINNLTIDLPNSDNVGLFGVTAGADIRNLGIASGEITGKYYVGAIIGYNISSGISKCFNKATLKGITGIGGICGRAINATTLDCYNKGPVTGTTYIGGVIGYNQLSTINNTYNTGIVIGTNKVGSITGINTGTIVNSYWLTGSADKGVGEGTDNTQERILADMTSDEFVEVLNAGRDQIIWRKSDVATTRSVTAGLSTPTFDEFNEVESFTLTFDKNGGQGDMYTQIFYKNAPNFINANLFYSDGKTFTAWNTSPDGKGSADKPGRAYKDQGLIAINQDLILYAQWADGTGSEDNPLIIKTRADMEFVNTKINGGITPFVDSTAFYKLGNDIDMGGYLNPAKPIGRPTNPFKGHFDGDNFTVYNFYANTEESEDYVGLFGYVGASGEIKNIKIGSGSIVEGNNNVGSLVGYNEGIVNNCSSAAQVSAFSTYNGGLIGFNYGIVEYSSFSGEINSSSAYIGGVIGYSSGIVEGCFNTGNVIATYYTYSIGGIIGCNYNGDVKDCYNTGKVHSTFSAYYVGGIMGYNDGGETKNFYNSGEIRDDSYGLIGGIVGFNDGKVSNSYNTGNLYGTDTEFVGGVCGYNDFSINNCFWLMSAVQRDNTGERENALKRQIGNMQKASDDYSKVEEELSNVLFLIELNALQLPSAWGVDVDKVNNGYPVLSYQTQEIDYQITFNASGAQGEMNPQRFVASRPGILESNSFSWSGKTFTGWNTDPDGIGERYKDKGSFVLDRSVDLYARWLDGSGTSSDPFQLRYRADLEFLSEQVKEDNPKYNVTGVHYKLMNDIDMGSSSEPFTQIGTWNSTDALLQRPFRGIFDGGNKELLNVYINTPKQDYVGIFGYLASGAEIKNFGIGLGSTIIGRNYVGGIVGYAVGNISRCYNASTTSISGDMGGNTGIFGTYLDAFGAVIAEQYGCYVGGVVGYTTGTVDSCYNKGIVEGNSHVGGIIGASTNEVSNCYNLGSITAKVHKGNNDVETLGENVGGIIGVNGKELKHSYSTGNITGRSNVGGIIGNNTGAALNTYYAQEAVQTINDVKRLISQVIGIGAGNNAGKGSVATIAVRKFSQDMKDAMFSVTLNSNQPPIIGNIKTWGYDSNIDNYGKVKVVNDGYPLLQFNQPHANVVNYNANGGLGASLPKAISASFDEKITIEQCPIFNRLGYSQMQGQWSTAKTNYVPDTTYIAGQEYIVRGNITFYVMWVPNPYNVYFSATDSDGGAIMTPQVFIYDKTATIKPNTYSRTGHTFAGWAEISVSNSVKYLDQAMYSTAARDITLYAKWQALPAAMPIIVDQPTSKFGIYGEEQTLSLNITPQALHTYTYQWYKVGKNENSNGTAIQDATNSSYVSDPTIPALVANYFYCVVTSHRTDNDQVASIASNPVMVSLSSRRVDIKGIKVADKQYDGNTEATIDMTNVTLNNIVAGDDVELVQGVIEFNNKYIGNDKIVTVLTNFTLTGTSATNYYLVQPSPEIGLHANITRKDLTISATAANKVYDKKTLATISLSSNQVPGDVISLSYTAASFEKPDVANDINVNITGISISGADAGNYNLIDTTAIAYANISQKTLNVSINAKDKIYDKTNLAEIDFSDDRIAGDVFDVIATSKTFIDKTAGKDKLVTVNGMSLTGAQANNYKIFTTSATDYANISAKNVIIIGAEVSDKIYDGNKEAAPNPAIELALQSPTRVDNDIAGEKLQIYVGKASFVSKDVADDISVTFNDYMLMGEDSPNYLLTAQPANATASITPKALTITANQQAKEIGSALTLIGTEFSVQGLIGSEKLLYVTLNSTGFASNAQIGSYQIIPTAAQANGPSGFLPNNYEIKYQNGKLSVCAKFANANGITIFANDFQIGTNQNPFAQPEELITLSNAAAFRTSDNLALNIQVITPTDISNKIDSYPVTFKAIDGTNSTTITVYCAVRTILEADKSGDILVAANDFIIGKNTIRDYLDGTTVFVDIEQEMITLASALARKISGGETLPINVLQADLDLAITTSDVGAYPVVFYSANSDTTGYVSGVVQMFVKDVAKRNGNIVIATNDFSISTNDITNISPELIKLLANAKATDTNNGADLEIKIDSSKIKTNVGSYNVTFSVYDSVTESNIVEITTTCLVKNVSKVDADNNLIISANNFDIEINTVKDLTEEALNTKILAYANAVANKIYDGANVPVSVKTNNLEAKIGTYDVVLQAVADVDNYSPVEITVKAVVKTLVKENSEKDLFFSANDFEICLNSVNEDNANFLENLKIFSNVVAKKISNAETLPVLVDTEKTQIQPIVGTYPVTFFVNGDKNISIVVNCAVRDTTTISGDVYLVANDFILPQAMFDNETQIINLSNAKASRLSDNSSLPITITNSTIQSFRGQYSVTFEATDGISIATLTINVYVASSSEVDYDKGIKFSAETFYINIGDINNDEKILTYSNATATQISDGKVLDLKIHSNNLPNRVGANGHVVICEPISGKQISVIGFVKENIQYQAPIFFIPGKDVIFYDEEIALIDEQRIINVSEAFASNYITGKRVNVIIAESELDLTQIELDKPYRITLKAVDTNMTSTIFVIIKDRMNAFENVYYNSPSLMALEEENEVLYNPKNNNNNNINKIEKIEIQTINYNLNQGWNLISIPLNNADTKELMNVVESAFQWNYTSEKYEQIETLTSGLNAYLVYVNQNCSINVYGEAMTSNEVTLNQGWNLYGVSQNVILNFQSINVQGVKDQHNNDIKENSILIKGKAYWFFSNEETIIRL